MSIQVKNLKHIYEKGMPTESVALEGVSFEVEDGELLGIIGHTGSGKSTLLQHLNGLLKPDEGTIVIGGVDITATAYSAGSGAINITKVTGAVTITAAASAPSVTYTITRNLTNCASSNTANTVAEGASYTTTLSPTGTYKKLGTITVTMGGTDISASAVSGSTVSINKVTGNIAITCAAEITNIIDTIMRLLRIMKP